MIRFSDYRSILCLHGDLPEVTFFECGLPIIAADGAANTLMQMGIRPQLVIGDLDGISKENAAELDTLLYYDQDFSDFQKCLRVMQERHLLPAIILGVNGGYLDHILNNVNIFLTTKSVLYAPPLYGFSISAGESKSLLLPLNTKISLLGIPDANVSSQGLKWELQEFSMSFPGKTSCFNVSVAEEVHLTVHAGNVLVLVYFSK